MSDRTKTPLISVVMPVWNGERHLREAMDGILQQTFTDFEFIIVDDGSTDDTADLIRSYRDVRVRFLRQPHTGIVKALNWGIAEARSDWVARQDADDISRSDRLALQWQALQKKADTVLCHTRIEMIGESQGVKKSYTPSSQALMQLQLCCRSPIVHSTVVFHKPSVQAAGGYRAEERHAEDFGLWGRLIQRGAFLLVRKPLVQFRVHGGSISRLENRRQQELTREIALRHACQFLGTSPKQAEQIVSLLMTPANKRAFGPWLTFVHGVAGLRAYRHPEVLSWLLSQTLRTALSFNKT